MEGTRKVIGAKVMRGAIVARWPLQEVKITVNVSAGTKNVASAICNIAVEPDYRGRYRRRAMYSCLKNEIPRDDIHFICR